MNKFPVILFEIQEIRYYFEIATYDPENMTLYNTVKAAIHSISSTYLDGTHSTCEQLSFYGRLYLKSNQAMENYNRIKNRRHRETSRGGRQSSNFIL